MSTQPAQNKHAIWLLLATWLVAIASLIYELIAATLSSYLLGDSVRQFSFVIGVFLATMGMGAWLSRFTVDALQGFVRVQVALGVVGGAMAPVIYAAFAYTGEVQFLLYLMLGCVGVLSGMEIPLIARVLKEIGATRFRFENVLSVDYLGALIASLAFPLVIVPHLGLMSASLMFGCLNLVVAGISIAMFHDKISHTLKGVCAAAFLVMVAGLAQSERLVSVADAALFQDDLILSETTPYQNIAVTRFRDRTRLFLDHSIQFDTADEYRYHEMLVHPALAHAPRRTNVMILGGGDGMAVREVLKYEDVVQVTLVDLDPRVTELFRDHAQLKLLNDQSLSDPRVTIMNQDAWAFAQDNKDVFDVIVIDLPDPKNLSLSKLYSIEFYATLIERLSPRGVLVTQAGSPFFAHKAFWSVAATWEGTRNPSAPSGQLIVRPYHTYVPSFGEWGFVMVSQYALAERPLLLPQGLRYATPEIWEQAQVFASDTRRVAVEVNTIQTHPLVRYYQDGWDAWFQ
ncbi:polyamine aminopropyltransferase [Sulfitobacter sp.]|uniref:polyamine aminopropyltransferase n=1 Tax=Sulfitobacter sp. TaxID=1903071 RepID=UPI003299FA34